jgi:hypothetical protein
LVIFYVAFSFAQIGLQLCLTNPAPWAKVINGLYPSALTCVVEGMGIFSKRPLSSLWASVKSGSVTSHTDWRHQ